MQKMQIFSIYLGMVYQVMLLLYNFFKAVSVELIKIISAIKTVLRHYSLYCFGGMTCSCTYSSCMSAFVPLYNMVRESFLEIKKQHLFVCAQTNNLMFKEQ